MSKFVKVTVSVMKQLELPDDLTEDQIYEMDGGELFEAATDQVDISVDTSSASIWSVQ